MCFCLWICIIAQALARAHTHVWVQRSTLQMLWKHYIVYCVLVCPIAVTFNRMIHGKLLCKKVLCYFTLLFCCIELIIKPLYNLKCESIGFSYEIVKVAKMSCSNFNFVWMSLTFVSNLGSIWIGIDRCCYVFLFGTKVATITIQILLFISVI